MSCKGTKKCATPDCEVKMKPCKLKGGLCPTCAAKLKNSKKI